MSESANHSASCIIAHASYAPANWLEHIRESLKTLSLCCNTQAKNHVGTIPVPPRKITFAEMRDMGVRGLLVYCADYRCSHSIAINGDGWPDDVRLSDIEHRFVCEVCGKRGADVRPDFNWNRKQASVMGYR